MQQEVLQILLVREDGWALKMGREVAGEVWWAEVSHSWEMTVQLFQKRRTPTI